MTRSPKTKVPWSRTRSFIAVLCLAPVAYQGVLAETGAAEPEVFYHLFQRSFFDTNGDRHGDLNGVVEKLDYLQDLGVTSVLMLPLYPSIYHHNYFAADFEGIDAEYGSMDDYLHMVESLHARGMKFYMDTEIQYVTENHKWFKDSRNNLNSPYSDHIVYRDRRNAVPETAIFDITHLRTHDGNDVEITTTNTNSPEVRQYIHELFAFWVDPNKDGDFSDGVDGFRIDHMMDDLDNKGILTDLLAGFWAPLFRELKTINPNLKIIAEQAAWTDPGGKYFSNGGVDMTFGFAIREGLLKLDKALIEDNSAATFAETPEDNDQLIFLENHDVPRYATVVRSDPGKKRVAAAFTLLSQGVPLIYYGQELGMEGIGGIGDEVISGVGGDEATSDNNDWHADATPSAKDIAKLMAVLKNTTVTDGNDIPIREAFEWYASVEGPGMAYWYRDIEQWWRDTNLKDNDGISLQEQRRDPGSLWNTYKNLITLRKEQPAIAQGTQQFIDNGHPNLLTFVRAEGQVRFLVALNLSSERIEVVLPKKGALAVVPASSMVAYYTDDTQLQHSDHAISLQISAHGIGVWKL